MTPSLIDAATEHSASYRPVSPTVADCAGTAFAAGALWALQVAHEHGIDGLAVEIATFGALMPARRRAHDSAPKRID